LQAAISKGQQLKEIAEQKAKFEAERQAEQERRNAELEAKAKAVADAGKSSESKEPEVKQEVLHTLCFQVTGTKEQLLELSNFMKAKNIKFEQIKESQ
jgi:membrane protein involved in colicin uptake